MRDDWLRFVTNFVFDRWCVFDRRFVLDAWLVLKRGWTLVGLFGGDDFRIGADLIAFCWTHLAPVLA